MTKILILIKLLFLSIILISCVEKPTYYGKIIEKNIEYNLFNTKDELIKSLGQPNFIDPIENKYYYYSEKKLTKNFFKNRVEYINMIVFKFNKENNITSYKINTLNSIKEIKISKDNTPNELVERGLIEKIFGGIGKQSLPNTSQ